MAATRRDFVKGAVLVGAGLGFPAVARRAYAADPIKIGIPTILSGGAAQYGVQVKRACELFSKDVKARGGVLGRPVEFIFEDTAGDPANAVRKAQKLVERDGVRFLTGVVLSSEALAVTKKCQEWKVVFMSTINGVGSLTTKEFHRYFFRVNTSGPMGTWAVLLYLQEAPMKRFYGLGSDYAWGRDSLGLFERTVKAKGKEIVGLDFAPLNTKDFGTYIAKIRQAKPDGVFLVMPGQDSTIMFKQSAQFGLSRETKLIHEILQLEDMKVVGDAMTGVIGGSRYPFTLDNPKNRAFVQRFFEMHKVYPDMFDGETYEGLEWLTQVMEKVKSDDVEKVVEAWEDSAYDGLEGRMVMRKCDHQAAQPGFVCEAVKDARYPHLVPKILGSYPAEKATPKCLTEEFA